MTRKMLGVYLLCASLYEAFTDYREFHSYDPSFIWVPRPGLLILLDWIHQTGMRTSMWADVICTLWLFAMGCAIFFTPAVLKLYIVSEAALLVPSVLYLLIMFFTPSGHAVPSFAVLLLQLIVIGMFSGLPLWWAIRLIRRHKPSLDTA